MATFDRLNTDPSNEDSITTAWADKILNQEFRHLAGEGQRLRNAFTGESDSLAIVSVEDFEGMPYDVLYAQVSGIRSDGVNAVADVWRNHSRKLDELAEAFARSTGVAISEKWTGRAAEAVLSGLNSFLTSVADLPVAMTMTANGMDVFEAQLAYARLNVPPPSTQDVSLDMGPGNWVDAKATQHEALEAEYQARLAMATVYRPGVEGVDANTVVLPGALNPVVGVVGTSTSDAAWSGSAQQNSNSGNEVAAIDPAETRSVATDSTNQDQSDQGTAQQATEASQSQPADSTSNTDDDSDRVNQASWMQDPVGRTPTDATPATRFTPDTTSTDRPSWRSDTATPVVNPGAPFSNSPLNNSPLSNSAQTSSAAQNARQIATTTRPGMAGMPGMGAGRARNDEENEHKTPDYLITVDNGNELLGKIRKVAPPVFGV